MREAKPTQVKGSIEDLQKTIDSVVYGELPE
jgi:hypothetical protein